MLKFVSLISASALASATVFAPISISSARADEGMGARAYFSMKFGAGESLKNRAQYGFQLNKSWNNYDDAIDPFASQGKLTVFDFAMGQGGVAKANLLGLDTIKAYDIWTGKDRFNQNADGGGGFLNPTTVIGGLVVGGVLACVIFEFEPCDNDSPEMAA